MFDSFATESSLQTTALQFTNKNYAGVVRIVTLIHMIKKHRVYRRKIKIIVLRYRYFF